MDFMRASPDEAERARASSCGMMSEDFRFVVVMGCSYFILGIPKMPKAPASEGGRYKSKPT